MDDTDIGDQGTVGRKKGKKTKKNATKKQTDETNKERLEPQDESTLESQTSDSTGLGDDKGQLKDIPNSTQPPKVQANGNDIHALSDTGKNGLMKEHGTNSSDDSFAQMKKIAELEEQLAQSKADNAQLDDKYKGLLGRVASIKTTLTDRLNKDADELQKSKAMVEELEERMKITNEEKKAIETSLKQTLSEKKILSDEVQDLRHRLSIAQQNWTREREEADIIRSELAEELQRTRKSVQDWEVLAMEESSVRRALEERCADIEEQFVSQKDILEKELVNRNQQTVKISDLQGALNDIQQTRKKELRDMVETSQATIDNLTSEKAKLQEQFSAAEAQVIHLSEEIQRMLHFESEVKEKTLLIGKLRHQGVILNEHLTKALRMIKRGDAQDNVDRQLVTNLFLSFLGLPRGDAKRFEVLQLIASYLKWSDEDRETAGLSRPGTSNFTGSIPSRSMQSPVLQSQLAEIRDSNSSNENLAELWASFLQQQAEKGIEISK